MNFTMTAIDSAIGMIFVYLLMASICSVLQEIFANLISWRGTHLRKSIKSMLSDPDFSGLAKKLYDNPRIATLTFTGKLPSYIPSATFAAALVDVIVSEGTLIKNGQLVDKATGPLVPFIKDAGADVEKMKAEFAKWFDQAMDGFSGWYKRNVQLVLFAIALVIAAALNVNSLSIARALWTQPALREAVVQSATISHQQGNAADSSLTPQEQFSALEKELDTLPLPIGWGSANMASLAAANTGVSSCWAWLTLIAGWVATALATSLGTQFWFQTLGSALQLRAAGASPEEKAKAAAAGK